MPDMNTISILIIVIVVVVDRVINILKSRGIDLQLVSKQIQDLWDWHNVNDTEGVKLWYVRRSLEEAITKLATNIELETKLLDRIDRRFERIEDKSSK